jgi:hypothetical protein
MAQFSVKPLSFDPCERFEFRVSWDGRVVAGGC